MPDNTTTLHRDSSSGPDVVNSAPGATAFGVVTWNAGGTAPTPPTGTSATQVQGTAADGAAVAGNPVLIGGSDGTNAQTLAVTSAGEIATVDRTSTADANSDSNFLGRFQASDGGNASAIGAANFVFNGTTWDRLRSVTNGMDSAGTGVTAAGMIAQFDDTATGTVTENQFAPLRITSSRELLAMLPYANVTGADGVANATPGLLTTAGGSANRLTVRPEVFNGTTWDRLRGDATNGLEVQGAGVAGTPSGGVVTVQGVSGGTAVATTSPTPAAADVLAGHLAHTVTTAAADFLTVAAGETWMGTISICCDVGIAAASSTAGQALGVVTTAGTDVTPAAGTYLSCEARAGANAATGTVGSNGANSVVVQDFIIVAPGGNTVSLQGTTTIAGTAGRVSYAANGRYL